MVLGVSTNQETSADGASFPFGPYQAAAPSKAGKNSKVKSSANVESEEEDHKESNGVSSSKAAAAPPPTADGESTSPEIGRAHV